MYPQLRLLRDAAISKASRIQAWEYSDSASLSCSATMGVMVPMLFSYSAYMFGLTRWTGS